LSSFNISTLGCDGLPLRNEYLNIAFCNTIFAPAWLIGHEYTNTGHEEEKKHFFCHDDFPFGGRERFILNMVIY
jgi:hypothetical protein